MHILNLLSTGILPISGTFGHPQETRRRISDEEATNAIPCPQCGEIMGWDDSAPEPCNECKAENELADELARTAAYLEVVRAAKAWRTAECDCNADMYEGSHRPECAVWIAEDSLSSAVDALPVEPAPPAEPGGSAPRKETPKP